MVHGLRVTVARARPLASSSRAKDSMRPADREQGQGAGAAPGGELAQVQRYASLVRPRYPAGNPARASRSASVKAGWMITSAVDGAVVVIGHLPAWLNPEALGQLRVPAIEQNPNVSRVSQSQNVTARPASGR